MTTAEVDRPGRFSLVDRLTGIRLECETGTLEPGKTAVVESSRRLKRERSYGFVHALWWVEFDDGRSIVSVPPRAGELVSAAVSEGLSFGADAVRKLKPLVDRALSATGVGETDRVLSDVVLACDASRLTMHRAGDCRRLVDASTPAADGIRLPEHCFPGGVVYGVVEAGRVVSVAFAHRTGVMEDKVADLGVDTAPAFWRRGYAKTCVSHVAAHLISAGGEARYACNPDNAASVATAASAGFVSHARSAILAAPAQDLAGT